jgi:hypothetical protein
VVARASCSVQEKSLIQSALDSLHRMHLLCIAPEPPVTKPRIEPVPSSESAEAKRSMYLAPRSVALDCPAVPHPKRLQTSSPLELGTLSGRHEPAARTAGPHFGAELS